MTNRVKEIRERRQIELETLAERIGVSPRLLSALETDATVATVDVAFKLAAALRAPIDELFFVDSTDGRRIVFSREKPTLLNDDIKTESKKDAKPFEPANANSFENNVQTPFESTKNVPETVDFTVPKMSEADSPTAFLTELVPSEIVKIEEKRAPTPTTTDSKKKKRSVRAPKSPSFFDAPEFLKSESPSVPSLNPATPPPKVGAPTKSERKSSKNSKTAVSEGLAPNPSDLSDPTKGRPIRFFDLFCGIGGFRFAAERTFAKMNRVGTCALSCDFDVPAQQSYSANFGETPFGDVATLPSEEIPDFDLLFAGFPCQAFSIIGLRKGFADETKGSLFFQIARILRDKRPRAFVLENVRQLTTHDSGRTFATILRILQDELGYCVDWRVMNALDCGLPQKRERVAIVGSVEPFEIAWPSKATNGKTLADILENDADVDRKYFASPEIVRSRKEAHQSKYHPAIWHENKSGNVSSYPYSCALRAGASYNYLLVNGERRLTSRELLRLQGFPDSFKITVSDSQLRKQAGNAAPVNLVERVLDRFLPLVFACDGRAGSESADVSNVSKNQNASEK